MTTMLFRVSLLFFALIALIVGAGAATCPASGIDCYPSDCCAQYRHCSGDTFYAVQDTAPGTVCKGGALVWPSDCNTPCTAGPAPTQKATAAPTQKATSAPTQKATSAPTQKATSAPTQKATAAPTQKATAAPTQKATSAPTQKATSAPVTQRPTEEPEEDCEEEVTQAPATQRPTSAPTQKATAAPTQKATSAPTQKATSAPTQKATAAPTQKATSAPTQKATSAPTQKATSPPSSNGKACPAGSVWTPAPGTTWQWQLTGSIDTKFDVQMYDIDLFDNSASTIANLQAQGRVVICYFSTQYEEWRPDAKNWPKSVLGNKLDNWPGENWVDIRTDTVRNLLKARLDLAVTKGCDGVEPDNVDEYTNNNGLGLTAADQLNFNSFLADEAHKRGLSIGLKNDLAQISQLVNKFDWVLNEQCNEYNECNSLKPFITANKAAFGVDYEGSASNICPKMVSSQYSWLMKDLSLGSKINAQCCTYASGGCSAKPAHRCVRYNTKRSEIDGTEELVVDDLETAAPFETETANFEAQAQQHSAASSTTISAAAILSVAVAALVL